MSYSRRRAIHQLIGAGFFGVGTFAASRVHAETYQYDALGRLTQVTYPDGSVVTYEYDAAGNRALVTYPGGPPFSATIAITGAGPVNLRTLANIAGYNGAQDATITFTLANGVTITGASGGHGIDTGTWPTGTQSIDLDLQISGNVYGGGGSGGGGASGVTPADNGGAGGHAINCQVPIDIVVNSGGQVKGGGGGGGGGGGWDNGGLGEERYGGGGGGGFPNGAAGLPGAAAGTTSGGGSGGAGQPGSLGHAGGAGGAGGGAATVGVAGTNGSGSTSGGWVRSTRGLGGAAGYAIRKNGNTVGVVNNGTITGTVG